MKKSLPILTVLSVLMSANSFAQYRGYYDGPAVDVNFGATKPAKYAECDRFRDNTIARYLYSCEFGRDEADRMAERFGGGNGKIQGYLRGYAWGLYKSVRAYENDQTEYANGAAAVDSIGNSMKSGLEAGRAKGAQDGANAGADIAIKKFREAMASGSQQLPARDVEFPPHNYEGEDNAYQKYVGPIPTVQSIMKNELSIGQLKVYSSYDSTFLGEMRPVTAWDLWFADGTYAFEKAYWYDSGLAWKTWTQRPIDTKPKYNSLNEPIIADPVSGKPLDFKATFQSAFTNSYSWYVNYYFSSKFYEWIDEGQRNGEETGLQVGKRIAHYKGLQDAFNKKFKELSRMTYATAYEEAFTREYNKTFDSYAKNAILSVSNFRIVGNDNDGIIQPGEMISATFDVTNVGGIETDINVSMSGDVMAVKPQGGMKIGRLTAKSFTVQNIAQIDSRLNPKQRAHITLSVNGVQVALDQLIQRMIEITPGSTAVNVMATKGNGDVTVNLGNVSTQETPGLINVKLLINNTEVKDIDLGKLPAGANKVVSLDFSNLDPLTLMALSGQYTASVQVMMGSIVLDHADGIRLSPTNAKLELARYFDQILRNEAYIPTGTRMSDRLSEVSALIVRLNNDETLNHRELGKLWKYDQAATMIGKVRDQFKGHMQTEDAKDQYNQLAVRMWPARKNLPKFLFFKGGKRKGYEAMCKELSKTGKL